MTAHPIPEPALAASGSRPEHSDRMCMPCIEAEADPLRHYYANGCTSCQARAIAALGLHQDSINAGRVLPEMGELLRTLFKDGPTEGWAAVREWGAKVDRARKAKQRGNAQ